MSNSLSLPKVKLISPDKKRIYYEKILSDTPYDKNNNNKIKNIQINKANTSINKSPNINTNINIDNMQTTEAISNIIDLINDNNLNIFYKEDSSNFKRNIDQLNLKFYLETEKIISSNQNQNKSKEENYYFYSNKLFLILFKQINLYIKEIERLNALMISSVKDTDNMKKKLAIFIRKQNDFETKEQIIQTLKYSVSSLEKKLSNVLLSENNLRQEIQKLKKEKDYYYEYYKANIAFNNKKIQNNKNKGKNSINNINKSQTINNLQSNNNGKNSKYNTKDHFFTSSKDIILLNDASNLNLSSNEHKRNNSENDYSLKNNNNISSNNNNSYNNNKLSANLQQYNNNSPKRKGKNAIKIKNNGNNTNTKSIIRLCNYYSHNIEIDIPLGFKSKSPGKPFKSNNFKDLNLSKGKKHLDNNTSQKSTIINENKLDLNIVSNNNNTFIFDNSFIKTNKTIYNTINPNKDLSISRLFKNTNNLDKSYNNENEKIKTKKINSVILNKESNYKDLNTDLANLNNLENLLIEVKEYILNNENKNNNNNNKRIINNNKIKNIPKNKSNSLQNNNNNNNNGKKISTNNTNFK